jgi:leucyl aminopeptidase
MLNIAYTPNADFSANAAVFTLAWDLDTANSEHVRIRRKNIYKDIYVAQRKIAAIRVTWGELKVKKVYVLLSDSLLKEDKLIVEHALFAVLQGFLPDKHMPTVDLIVTHDSKTFHNDISDCLDKMRRVFAGRMMAMIPGNVATPETMSHTFIKMFKSIPGCMVKVFDEARLKKHKFGLILGVGCSTHNKPSFVFVERKGRGKDPLRVALVGKGITFDTGGLSIKNFANMADMKYDKIGAIYASMALIHMLSNKEWDHVTFYGAFPFAENAVSDTALHPGDVVRSYLGKTVEISDPDAEGRLVLADAFGYLHKYQPDLVIDIATLTGHAEIINCWHSGYYFANTKGLRDRVEELSDKIGERMIPMPLWQDYNDVLESNVADLCNSPKMCSDAFVAALFLQQFVPKGCDWVHIDLAHEIGPESIPRGKGIRTMINVLEDYIASNGKK